MQRSSRTEIVQLAARAVSGIELLELGGLHGLLGGAHRCRHAAQLATGHDERPRHQLRARVVRRDRCRRSRLGGGSCHGELAQARHRVARAPQRDLVVAIVAQQRVELVLLHPHGHLESVQAAVELGRVEDRARRELHVAVGQLAEHPAGGNQSIDRDTGQHSGTHVLEYFSWQALTDGYFASPPDRNAMMITCIFRPSCEMSSCV